MTDARVGGAGQGPGRLERTLTVGEVARRTGVAISTLHFYERKGLLHAERTPGNQRRYPRDAVRRVSFVRVAQRVGIPLARVAEALATLPSGRTPTREDWARLSASWRTELEERIATLERLRDGLDDCIGCGCLSLDRCMLANPGDVLGRELGPGPHRLLRPQDVVEGDLSGPAPAPSTG